MPIRIETLEAEQSALIEKMSASDYHAQGVEVIKADNERLKAIGEALTESYDRWEELETKREQIEGV